MSIKLDVGTPSSKFEGWATAEVRFHGFADLSTTRGLESPKFSCFGHQWRVLLWPGGRANSDDGYAALGLANISNQAIKIQWRLSFRDAADKEVVYHEPLTNEFGVLNNARNSVGQTNFARRSKLLGALIEGTLIIDVRMKLADSSKLSSQFIPENPLNKNILNKFNKEKSADVVFEVDNSNINDEGRDTGARKRAKTTTTFYAHRVILEDAATTLAEMCKPSADGGSVVTVSITDVKPDVFKQLLFYLYGGKLADKDLESNVKNIIDAADKYGIVSLKLEAEAFYVKSTVFNVENMIDNLLYADSKNLALLTEAVTDFIVENGDDILGKVSFDNVPGAMITDILAAVSRGKKNSNDRNNGTIDYNKMRVGTLRKMLHEKGLDVDGTREAMISALKASGEDNLVSTEV